MKNSKNSVARNLGLSICVGLGGVASVPMIFAASSVTNFVQAAEKTKTVEKKTKKNSAADETVRKLKKLSGANGSGIASPALVSAHYLLENYQKESKKGKALAGITMEVKEAAEISADSFSQILITYKHALGKQKGVINTVHSDKPEIIKGFLEKKAYLVGGLDPDTGLFIGSMSFVKDDGSVVHIKPNDALNDTFIVKSAKDKSPEQLVAGLRMLGSSVNERNPDRIEKLPSGAKMMFIVKADGSVDEKTLTQDSQDSELTDAFADKDVKAVLIRGKRGIFNWYQPDLFAAVVDVVDDLEEVTHETIGSVVGLVGQIDPNVGVVAGALGNVAHGVTAGLGGLVEGLTAKFLDNGQPGKSEESASTDTNSGTGVGGVLKDSESGKTEEMPKVTESQPPESASESTIVASTGTTVVPNPAGGSDESVPTLKKEEVSEELDTTQAAKGSSGEKTGKTVESQNVVGASGGESRGIGSGSGGGALASALNVGGNTLADDLLASQESSTGESERQAPSTDVPGNDVGAVQQHGNVDNAGSELADGDSSGTSDTRLPEVVDTGSGGSNLDVNDPQTTGQPSGLTGVGPKGDGSSSGALSETKVENYRQAVAKLFKDGGELLGKAGTASKGLESLIQSSKAPLQVARLDVGGQVPENIRDYVVVIEKPDGNTLLQRLQRTEEGGLKLFSPTQARSLLDMSKAGAKGTLGGETVNALLTQADAAGWKVKAIYGLQPDAKAEGGLSVVRYLPEEAFAKVEAALKAGKEVIAAIAEVEADAVKAAGDKVPAVEVAKVDGGKVPTVELAKVDGDKVPAVEVAKVDGDKVPAAELAKVDADSTADAAAAEPAAVAEEAEQVLAMLEAEQVPGLNNPALRRQAYADALAYMGRAASRFDGQLLDELGQDHGLAAGDSRLWAGLIGASESIGGSGDREDSKERSQGVAAGVVFQLRDDLTLGVALGQTVGKVSSDGKAKLDLTQVAVAGLHRLNGQDSGLYLGGGLGAAHAGIQAKRSHEGETARGKTSATQFHASVKLGSDIDVGDWTFEPSLGLMGVQTHLKGTREKNEGLHIKSQVHNSAFAQTGLNLSRNFQLEGWMLKPELSAQYQYRLSNPESVKVAYDDTSWRQPGATDKRGGAGFGLGLEVRKSLMRAKAEVGDDGAVNLSLGVSW